MNTWGRVASVASITTGVAGAVVLGGVAQRRAVRRHRSAAGDADSEEPYDALAADRTYSVVAPDGVALHVEEVGPEDAPLTVVFAHGWTLRSGAWHFQRIGLAGPGFGDPTAAGPVAAPVAARMVFYDQRSHGRSSRSSPQNATLDRLADDLAAVIATAVPVGPVVIIGHSMGGMALIALAGKQPGLFRERVIGIGLVSTAASGVALPGMGRLLVAGSTPVVKLLSSAAARYPRWIERGRSTTRDAVWLLTRALGFARTDVPSELVDYLDEMISGTPVDVIAGFMPAILGLDAEDALAALVGLPAAVICGDSDRVTPLLRSELIAAALPGAELVVIENAGHMATLEAPAPVNAALRRMLVKAAARAGLGRAVTARA